MTKIFISYRRADTQYVTDIVYEKMTQHFGKDNIFLDVGSIPFGVDFREYLNNQISEHDVVLVIIGHDWGHIMQERANQENDFVRIEVETALEQDKLVIPVLVKNAKMPNFIDLPESISNLQWRNRATIRRQPDLDADCKRLADSIREFAHPVSNTRLPKSRKPSLSKTQSTSKDIMPQPFEWVRIPKGKGMMETDQPRTNLSTPTESYWISKYPVTNAQFNIFVEAGGYDNKKYWSDGGWNIKVKNKWIEPNGWEQVHLSNDDQPVSGISWYEAIAFCLWLSDATSEKIVLPTENQWQYAAQGNDDRCYPWGKNWNINLCNTNYDIKYLGKTTPVTQYEGAGDSPFNVTDMVGNVWEWCLTDFDKMTNNINSNSNRRVLRGGSWNDNYLDFFRITNRTANEPSNRPTSFGFRLVRH